MLKNLRTKQDYRSFMYKETDQIPAFMIEQVKKDLGPMWEWLPDKTLSQIPNAVVETESLVSAP